MKVFKNIRNLRDALGKSASPVGLVPTMGALHPGHISLVERCRLECGTVVVSIFVNPTQFNDPTDLEKYPRTPQQDIEMLEKANVDFLFMPETSEIYPEKDDRVFDLSPLDTVMEGAHRPGHFNGVAQILTKLFDAVDPDRAYFGEKDFQQLAIIRELVRRNGYDIEITGCPTLREEDGLAMSSRNTLLTPSQRKAAPLIHRTLAEAVASRREKTIEETLKSVIETINDSGELETEYFLIADEDTLLPVATWSETGSIRGFIAVKAGNIRLIDNIKFV